MDMAKGNMRPLGKTIETKVCNELVEYEPHKNDRTSKRFISFEQSLGEQGLSSRT